jgi:putative nucleotidyltransferase with HDIG domain
MKSQEKFFTQLNKSLESDQGTLPIFSAVSLQIQVALIKDQPDLKTIEKLISEDQSLSSSVLRRANSVWYCGLVDTTTVRSAIVRLGMAEIMQIVSNDINNKLFSSLDDQIDVIMKQLWQHSVGCAFSAGMLANTLNCGVIREEAFTAGLFHDIGKLLILKVIEGKKKAYKVFDIAPDLLLESIKSLHAKHGYRLMDRMKIPKMYAVVARDHHLKRYDHENFLLVLVRLANTICHQMGIGFMHDPAIDVLSTEEAVLLNLTEPQLDKVRHSLLNNPSIIELPGTPGSSLKID